MGLHINAQELLEYHDTHHFGNSRIRQHILQNKAAFLANWDVAGVSEDSMDHTQGETSIEETSLEDPKTHSAGGINLSELVLDPEALEKVVSEEDYDDATKDFVRTQMEHRRRFRDEIRERNLAVKTVKEERVSMNY